MLGGVCGVIESATCSSSSLSRMYGHGRFRFTVRYHQSAPFTRDIPKSDTRFKTSTPSPLALASSSLQDFQQPWIAFAWQVLRPLSQLFTLFPLWCTVSSSTLSAGFLVRSLQQRPTLWRFTTTCSTEREANLSGSIASGTRDTVGSRCVDSCWLPRGD
ncbi:hypothetical protein MPH_11443 [Macrophomina phaseolina MS6]|uniref:Uncharacterized protein n=1 Tax=Macrophomina phaseolina (strain MS6) TaxID=1126212 RepID=K2RAC2_MACPH|nr:hypothetical protein MPH_11443 [Macrophomina phaseolina MS6]